MREKFLNYADKLINQQDLVKVYKDLIKIFDENFMFHEVGACNEKLWHITQEPEQYKIVGDIFANKVGNFDIALLAYHRYLQFLNLDFFMNYRRVLQKLGFSNLCSDLDEDDYSRKIITLCDAYDTIIYMTICLFQNKDYDSIIEMDKKLTALENSINKYLTQNPSLKEDDSVKGNYASKKHLSEILSKKAHHNDINFLAIKYDEKNKQAYINIIDDYITYKNYNDAILFYNYTYCNAFELNKKSNIIDICWDISDYYRDKYDFYNAVLFQKYALENELTEG